jgi:hypothetical protein
MEKVKTHTFFPKTKILDYFHENENFLYFVKTNFLLRKKRLPFHANLTQLYGKTLSRLLAEDADCAELVETIQYSSKERLRYLFIYFFDTY